MNRRQDGPRPRTAFLASVVLHAAAIGAVTLGALNAEPAPRQVRVYRVDIVSAAPNVAGEPPAVEPSAPPAAEPEPVVQPEPPAPEPRPEPPTPESPAETPRQPAPRPEEPKRPAPERPRPTETPRRTEAARPETPRNREPAERPSTERSTSERNVPATGRNPDPASPGGEGLNVRTRGVACPENYCNNVVRQVRRFFRAPEGTQGASGNVCFTLFRDGSVSDVTVERQRGGGFQFRLALVEAVEQAGLQRAFGRLPAGFQAESIQLCVQMSPATT